jgi:iron(II)-dependent oxidoreductase
VRLRGRWKPAPGFRFVSAGVEVEGTDAQGVGEQYEWEPHPQRAHDHVLSLPSFDIMRHPVTNEQYERYLNATGYRPADGARWLDHWDWPGGSGGGGANRSLPGVLPRLPAALRRQPLVWVGLQEARRYCGWRQARLPTSYEWQYSAQGMDSRLYPWGNSTRELAMRRPDPVGGAADPVLADVDAHPAGASPFGVQDLVGNVWQMTDEFRDAHTRALVLRGSSRYQPGNFGGSKWYHRRNIVF